MKIAVALKWVDQRPEIDALSGSVHDDERSSGTSPADQAALEWALRCSDAWSTPEATVEVLVVTAGPPQAEGMLREALACGADTAIRVEHPAGLPSDVVARSLAGVLSGCDLLWCGDYSSDRGTGSVPAFLAAHLAASQALGLVQVDLCEPGHLVVTRRLDGGRRERLDVRRPAVLSVEGSTARRRRAPLAATLAAGSAVITVVPGVAEVALAHGPPTRPFRPRARALPAPVGMTALDRIVALTDAAATPSASSDPIVLDPPAAANCILEALTRWGYRPRVDGT